VAVVAVPRAAASLRTYAGTSDQARVADLAAGLGLLAAGLVARSGPRTRRISVPIMVAGALWFAPDWEGWIDGPAVMRSVGAAAALLLPAVLLQLVVALSGRRRVRVAVVAAYAVAAIAATGRALVYEPFRDPYCWRNCTDNAFLVHSDDALARALGTLWTWSALAVGLLVAWLAARWLATASVAARRALGPVLVTVGVAGFAQAAYAAALIVSPLEDPHRGGFAALFFARALSLVGLAAAVAWGALRSRRMRAAVSRLAGDLGRAPAPGTLRDTLAAATGDPHLRVAYALSGDRWVDGDGHAVEDVAAGIGRAATVVVRAGRPLARVTHDAALVDGPDLQREIGSAARLAIENERLQAEVHAQLEDIRASRARVVKVADEGRRRLERDLHDGAQQRLLALSYDLRLARSEALRDGAAELAELLERAAEETQGALTDLRELAHGIYPAILSEAGLAPALATLADTAPLPVELTDTVSRRLGSGIETAAYVAVAEAIADAHSRGATHVTIAVQLVDSHVVIAATDDGVQRTSALVHLADRVGALGGTLEVGPAALRAEIPCA
jgi:signal transduction histidine kinase